MANLDPTGLASLALREVFRVGKDAAVNALNMKKLARQLDEEHLQELVPIVNDIVSMVDSMNPNHEGIIMRGVMQKLERIWWTWRNMLHDVGNQAHGTPSNACPTPRRSSKARRISNSIPEVREIHLIWMI